MTIEGGVMERDRVTPGELRGAFAHQSVLSAEDLEVEIEQALARELPTFDVAYETAQGHTGLIRLLMFNQIAQTADAGVIYSFLLHSGADTHNQREVTILIPSGGGRALISLPY